MLKCPICGIERKQLRKHIEFHHKMNLENFINMYPNTLLTCDETRNKQSKIKIEYLKTDKGKEQVKRAGEMTWEKEGFREMMVINNSNKTREKWKSEGYRERVSPLIKTSLNCERIHNLHSERLKSQWRDDTYRKKITSGVADMLVAGRVGVRKNYIRENGCEIILRSSLEFTIVNYMDTLGIKFEYETRRFGYIDEKGNSRIYIPDFFLKDLDIILEVKPKKFTDEKRNMMKFNSVKQNNEKIYYVTENELESLDTFKQFIENLRV